MANKLAQKVLMLHEYYYYYYIIYNILFIELVQ